MKCPLKKNSLVYKNPSESLVVGMVEETTIEFGECEKKECAAWNRDKPRPTIKSDNMDYDICGYNYVFGGQK